MENEIDSVKELGSKIGYGHLMCLASALWRKHLKENGTPESGALVPCLAHNVLSEENKMYDEYVYNQELINKLINNLNK